MNITLAAQTIAERIRRDISGRIGLGDEWDQIDNDIQKQIIEDWEITIKEELMKASR